MPVKRNRFERRRARAVAAKAERRERKLAHAVDRVLAADGVLGRVLAVRSYLEAPGGGEAISKAMSDYALGGGLIDSYEKLRSVVSTHLSEQGLSMAGVLLKFEWNPKTNKLGIYAAVTPEVADAARQAVKKEHTDRAATSIH